MRHPGVVRILDYSTTSTLPWYAMERLEGLTLEQVCAVLGGPGTADHKYEATLTLSREAETGSAAAIRAAAGAAGRR